MEADSLSHPRGERSERIESMPQRQPQRRSNGLRKRLHARAGAAPLSTSLQGKSSEGTRDAGASFRTDCETAIRAIRAAVGSLARSVDVDPLKPQEVARRLKLNKNLTWKFARILLADDCLDAVPMVPGPEGVDIFLRAFERMKAPAAQLEEFRAAAKSFDEMVERHFGSRAELEFVLDGLRADGNLEQPRRLAFRGAAGVFGLQAAARVVAHFVTPSASDPERADLSLVAGLAGLRRLRPMGNLPVFRSVRSGAQEPLRRPLFARTPSDLDNFLIEKYTSVPHASVTSTEAEGRLSVQIGGGPIGRIGDADLYFGTRIDNAFHLVRRPSDTVNELVTAVSIPCESIVSDLFVHRSIRGLETLRASMHGTLSGPLPQEEELREIVKLPMHCDPLAIDDLDLALEVPRVARYGEMIRDVFEALGHQQRDFVLYRVYLEYPPVPAALLTRWDLPEA
jgi:hypothetical protein